MNYKHLLILTFNLIIILASTANAGGSSSSGQPTLSVNFSDSIGAGYVLQDGNIKSTFGNVRAIDNRLGFNEGDGIAIVGPNNKSVLAIVAGKLIVADDNKVLPTLADQRMIKFNDNDIDNRVGHVVWPIGELAAAAGLTEGDKKGAFLALNNSYAVAAMMKAVAKSGVATAEQGVKFQGLAQDIENGYIDLIKPAQAAQPGHIDIKFGSSLLEQPAVVNWQTIK